jgi:predicted transglutaminase-like cysteine proteinase
MNSTGKMRVYGAAFPPPAFKAFCASEPGLCSSTKGAKQVKLTTQRRAELERVNASVNRRVRPQNDGSAKGGDQWRVATQVGDCEDYAILKKKELMSRGWPSSSLLLTVATLYGQGHTVLTVRTDKGDLVLDNRTDRIRTWSETSYRYFARQSQTEYGKWNRIM